MHVYEIALPLTDNARKDMNGSHLAFQNLAMIHCDGYTKRPSGEGAWAGDDGRIYYDRMVPYRVACDEPELEALLGQTFSLFPDQKAIMVSLVGSAAVIRAPDPRLPDKATIRDNLSRVVSRGLVYGSGDGGDGGIPPASGPSIKNEAKDILAQIAKRRLALSAIEWELSEQLRAYDRNPDPYQEVSLGAAAQNAKKAAAQV